ncbi:response regulator transcription factor [Streptomyces durbertensis]|uniref:Response regulator transcription factor n=1 Tax=Streptomyces durbertensis TaxID=2448886 RepID=A0ABR6EE92_9ACTN|nr:response regulator transcription factor [Streptomyces durbertensis]MBB1243640.1 response regulator transcription factor [Streptomyces durbertensis]
MTRVLVAGEQRMLREALAAALGLEDGVKVVAQAGSGPEVVSAARVRGPEVALISTRLPGADDGREPPCGDGINTVHALRLAVPGCRSLVVFGGAPGPGQVRSALLAGAAGYLHTGLPFADLVAGVHAVAAGEAVGDPEVLRAAREIGGSPLSVREREILRRVATGADTADIARELSLTVGTVRNHLSAAVRKLAARTPVDAVRIAADRDWLREPG